MKKNFLVGLAIGILMFGLVGVASATIIDSTDIGGFRTFKDTNTGYVWLDLDNFFNASYNEMKAAANAAGFTVANSNTLGVLFASLPSPGSNFDSYSGIIGKTPNRDLFWGAYDDNTADNFYRYAYAEKGGVEIFNTWITGDGTVDNDGIENRDTIYADMNLFAYKNGTQPPSVPEPATMMLLGLGLLGLAGVSRNQK